MPVPPPVPLISPLFSALERMEPGSEAFLPTLELFLQIKEERKLLEKLEGSAAIHAADVIEKARDRGVFSCEAWADLFVACGRAHVFRHSRIPQTYPSPPTLTLWVVGGTANLL